ncbi:MAG: phosphonate degradation HD-domain oxygenase [Pararobbsia sp.]
MALSIEDIQHLYEEHGGIAYSGEPVTQLEHALQSAWLAEQADAGADLVAAAFLHDLGHLLNLQGHSPTVQGIDDQHQYFAMPFLRRILPESVLEPIRLHVDAKRCLCAIDSDYLGKLSADSMRSLRLQGGVFSDDEARAFLAKPYAEDAMRLRRWDDRAKVASLVTPDLPHYIAVVSRVSQRFTQRAAA